MKQLYQLLARIDSKLNLLLAMVSKYQAKIPTVFARINRAKINLQDNKIEDLYFDLEWITTTILNKKDLRRLFEFQTLDLNVLKEELKRFFMAVKREDVFAKEIYKQRHSLARVFENLETFFIVLSEKTTEITFGAIKSSLQDTIATERSLKAKLLVPEKTTQVEIRDAIDNFTVEIADLNDILISMAQIERIEGMQKLFIYDCNKLMGIIETIFNEVSKETNSPIIARSVKRKGLVILEFVEET